MGSSIAFHNFSCKLFIINLPLFLYLILIFLSPCESQSQSQAEVPAWKKSGFYPLLMKGEIRLPFYQSLTNPRVDRPTPIYLSSYPRIASGSGSGSPLGPKAVWPSFPTVPSSEGNNYMKNKSWSGSGSGASSSSSVVFPPSKGSSPSWDSEHKSPTDTELSEEDYSSDSDYSTKSGGGTSGSGGGKNKLPDASAGGDNKLPSRPSSTLGGDHSSTSSTNSGSGNNLNSGSNSSSKSPASGKMPPSSSGNSTSKGPTSSMPGSTKTDSPKNSQSPSVSAGGGSGPLPETGIKTGTNGNKDSNNCSSESRESSEDEDEDCANNSSAENSSSSASVSSVPGKGNSTVASNNSSRPPTSEQVPSVPSKTNTSDATTLAPTTVAEPSPASNAGSDTKGNISKSCTSTNVGNHKLNFDYNWKIAGFFDYAKDSEKYAYPFAFKLENLTIKPDELPGSWYISLTQEPGPQSSTVDSTSVWSLNVTYQTEEDGQTYIEVNVNAKVGIKTYSYTPINANRTVNETDTIKEDGNSTIHSYVAFWEDIKMDKHKESIVSSSSASKDALELIFHVEALTIPKQLNSTDTDC